MLKKHTKHIIYIAIGLTVLFLLYALKNTSYFLRILGFFVAIFLFWAVDTFFNLKFKEYHYLIILLISTFGILLSPLYFISPIYDKILHLVAPILAGILVFFLVNKLETKFSIKLVLTFSIILSLLAMFEIGEYALDSLLNLASHYLLVWVVILICRPLRCLINSVVEPWRLGRILRLKRLEWMRIVSAEKGLHVFVMLEWFFIQSPNH